MFTVLFGMLCVSPICSHKFLLTDNLSSYGFYTRFTCDIYSSMSRLLRRTLRSGLEHIDVSFADFAMLLRCICNTEVMKRQCRM